MKTLQVVVLALTLAATSAAAQVALDESKPNPKSAQAAKPADAKKAPAPKKADAGKKADAPKKAAAPKKADPAKAQAPKKPSAPAATGNPNVKVYKAGDPGMPTLRDKDGKVIPTSPDAYDVSSAKK